MKYPVWFLRLMFAAWMIPAGLNHFYSLFPQPEGVGIGNELFRGLFDSHLFDIVKAVELIAGVCVLTGFYAPLALVVCMPVSFCVFYWDVPLSPVGPLSFGAILGWIAIISNSLLCIAYFNSYRAMFTLRATPRTLGGNAPPAAALPAGA